MDRLSTAPQAPSTFGEYRLIAEVAASPLGPLWGARALLGHDQGRIVAIRRLSTEPLPAAIVERLIQVAERTRSIRHSNLLATLEVVRSDQEVGIVSEYIEGETLASLQAAAIATGRPFPVSVALRIALDVLAALRVAKDQWSAEDVSFHGALFPHSVLVAAFGEAIVADLGLGRLALECSAMADLSTCARYCAPEVLTGDEVGSEGSDVYSLGVLLWELLAARRAPDARLNPNESQSRVTAQLTVPRLKDIGRTGHPVPETVARIVERALAVEAESRYASLGEMADAIEGLPQGTVAPSEQVSLLVDRLSRHEIETRRRRLGLSGSSNPPVARAPSNRPTFRPAPSSGATDPSRLPEAPLAASEDRESVFSDHEMPTTSLRARAVGWSMTGLAAGVQSVPQHALESSLRDGDSRSSVNAIVPVYASLANGTTASERAAQVSITIGANPTRSAHRPHQVRRAPGILVAVIAFTVLGLALLAGVRRFGSGKAATPTLSSPAELASRKSSPDLPLSPAVPAPSSAFSPPAAVPSTVREDAEVEVRTVPSSSPRSGQSTKKKPKDRVFRPRGL